MGVQQSVIGMMMVTSVLAMQPTGTQPATAPGATPGKPSSAPTVTPAQPSKETKPALKPAESASKRDDAAAEALGWKLGMQAWTFRDRTTEEAIQTTSRMGIKYMQLYVGQELSKSRPGVKVGMEMSAEDREALKKMLTDAKVTAVSLGVVGFKNNEAEARKTFEFAKAMGLERIAAEPDVDAWDVVAKLADEFAIPVACHNHPKPSTYWDPAVVLASIKGRTKRLGVCADTGHWKRSGLDPKQCLDSLSGLILELHFKDIDQGKDKPWGTGSCDAIGMLKVLQSQGFRGHVFVEYEDGAGAELDANVGKCVEFFDKTAIAAQKAPKK